MRKLHRLVCVCRFLLLLPLVLGSGCGPTWEAIANGNGPGYDVYRPEPYLLVAEAADFRSASRTASATQPVTQQYTVKVVYLPDYSTRYRIRSKSGGVSIWIKDGWELSSMSDQNSAANILAALAGAGNQAGTTGGDLISVLSLLGGQPISAQGSKYPSTSSPANPTPEALVGQRGVALYKIIYNEKGRVTGLVKIEPTQDEQELKAKLADHHPPAVPPG